MSCILFLYAVFPRRRTFELSKEDCEDVRMEEAAARPIDLRSDTVTWPTEEMRAAMASAAVGDDVFECVLILLPINSPFLTSRKKSYGNREDPTINRLEREAAEVFGKEAGLFVASGTQGNLIALLVHVPRGEEAIFGDLAHMIYYEAGGVAAVGGIMPRTVPVQPDGTYVYHRTFTSYSIGGLLEPC